MQATDRKLRLAVLVSGVVQGVGFRPFVYAVACRNGLSGFVRNNNGLVQIEVQGSDAAIKAFLHDLKAQAPPLAQIERLETSSIELESESDFRIEHSLSDVEGNKFMPPDAATCDQCLDELFDRKNRRYRYPFINCTNCGPRFTIIKSLPYDRQTTTMADFPLCRLCRQEYDDPANRRFHAQPNACFQCGPHLSWSACGEDEFVNTGALQEQALGMAIKLIKGGGIIAVKGLGGFHLICDAHDRNAIEKLRERKKRWKKPFALMMKNLAMVRLHCEVSEEEERSLNETSRPIVLLKKRFDSSIPDEIAPGTDRLGVMLPYTPLHHLLLNDYDRPIVATSANLSEEPIVIDNSDAMSRMKHLADGVLQHNRDIYSRYDDSIVQFVDGRQSVLRRGRGLAPRPIKLPFKSSTNVLAVGGHLKNTFCIVREDQAYISQHIGDLENIETEEHFQHTLSSYMKLFDLTPDLIAHDLHPDYLSTEAAQALAHESALMQGRSLPLFPVQHHHAHVVACMVEHGLTEEVIGIAFDGIGYGMDGTLWGGEFLLSRLKDYDRRAYFEPVPMPGGTKAIRQPWRMTLAYVWDEESADAQSESNGELYAPFVEQLSAQFGKQAIDLIQRQVRIRLNSPLTSSCGRLFDALSALLGVCRQADYEGQPAIELEALALRYINNQFSDINQRKSTGSLQPFSLAAYPYEVTEQSPYVVKTRPILKAAYRDLLDKSPLEEIAARFHYTIAQIIRDICLRLRDQSGANQVCLSGGVFQNRLLLLFSQQLLYRSGFQVFFPQVVPANDGGISLGQAVVALANKEAVSFQA